MDAYGDGVQLVLERTDKVTVERTVHDTVSLIFLPRKKLVNNKVCSIFWPYMYELAVCRLGGAEEEKNNILPRKLIDRERGRP